MLVFYPFDFSPVCTTELCRFRDAEWLTMTPDVDVWAISRDGGYAHQRFVETYDLSFPLLSDVEGRAVDRYDVRYDEFERHGGVAKRAVYVVDADRTIRYAWDTEDPYDDPDVSELAEVIESLPRVSIDGADD